MGKHMLGWQYLVEIADCSRELTARRNATMREDDQESQELTRALDIAITGAISVPS